MHRRKLLALAASAAAAPFAAALAADRVYRIGLMVTAMPLSDIAGPDPLNLGIRALVHALRDVGYIEGQNLTLERRSAEGDFTRFDTLLTELVDHKADVIVTIGNDAALAAKRVTKTVPIVMAASADPVAAGIVASLARPGGNITGFTQDIGPEIEAKRLELLKQALPGAKRIAFLGLKSDWDSRQGASVRTAARTLGVTLVHAEHSAANYADAFAMIALYPPQALFVARNPANDPNRQIIVDFALERHLPGSYPVRDFVTAGGLLSYGVSLPDLARRAAGLADKILKGAKPADLPVEQPVRFELVINGRTAKALGVILPVTLLAAADEVID